MACHAFVLFLLVAVAGEDVVTADPSLELKLSEMLAAASEKVLEGKERKKATLKNLLSMRPSPVADFGCVQRSA